VISVDALAARGGAVAIVSGDLTWSYADLATRASELATRLAHAGVGAGDLVALDLGRSPSHVTAMLAAWHLRAAFLPIDPSAPKERVLACLRESGARVVVSGGIDDLSITALETGKNRPSDGLAYVIYTSGSTGRPKGVRVGHGGLELVLDAQVRAFGLGPSKRALLTLSTAFDASISDIGTTLGSGATLVIPPSRPTPNDLVDVLSVLRITHADLPPAWLPLVDANRLPATLETVIVGGEVASPSAVRAWSKHVRVINVYGPTEATICTHLCVCEPTWSAPLLGRPLAHVRQRIVEGELWLAGPALALGYVDRPDLEAARFVTSDGERWYKTGDRVRMGDDGSPLFLGRSDRQLKVRGQLVSPEEVEARLLEIDGVASAVVTSRGSGLLATLVTTRPLIASTVRTTLARSLPEWMLPTIRFADDLPRGVTGKVDVRAVGRVEVIAHAFGDVLGVDASEDDDFFDLGGDSLAALEVVAFAASRGVSIDAAAIARDRTPSRIAWARPNVPTVRELHERAERILLELKPNTAHGAGQEWLITGGTGFLGSRAIARLRELTTARLNVLVRSPRELEGVTTWVGDVGLPYFGLDAASWDTLSARVGHVVHCAAAVNLALPFDALAPTNVRGALEVVRFARSGCSKVVTHVSSLAVLVQTDQLIESIDEHTALAPNAHVYGGYAQTKVVAEFIVSTLDARVVRPGLLTGDSLTGQSAKTCQLAWFLASLAKMGCVPAGDHERLRVDVTPIDHAADALANLAIDPKNRLITHIASRTGASLADLLRALRRHTKVVDVSSIEWSKRAREVLTKDAVMALLATSHRLLGIELHRDVDLFLMTDRRFEHEGAGIVDDALLDRYVRAALRVHP
jgi:amino acid adenylation domain-containing protein